MKLVSFPPAVMAADAREVPYHRRLISCQYGRCLAGVRPAFRQGCEKQHNRCQGRGQQRKRRARGAFHQAGQNHTAGYLVLHVF